MRRTFAIGLAALALLAFSPSPASANLTWNFSYSGYSSYYGNMDFSGQLITTDTAVPLTGTGWGGDVTTLTGYEILGISGVRNGVAVTGVVNNGNFPGATLSYTLGAFYDNALITGSPHQLDFYGLVYSVGNDWYNVYSNNSPTGGGFSETTDGDWHVGSLSSLTITPVPEPTTLVTGALLLLPIGVSTLRMLRKSRAA